MITDAQAEQAVLGALLLEPECWAECGDLLAPVEVFSDAAHRVIAETVIGILRAKKTLDIVTLTSALTDRGVLGKTVPQELPLALATSLGTPGKVRHYAERLRDLWAKRQAVAAAREFATGEMNEPAEVLLSRLVTRLQRIETGKAGQARRLPGIMLEVVEDLGEQAKNPNAAKAAFLPTGFRRLDDVIGGFRPGVLSVFAARPSQGKSALAVAMADNLAARGLGVAAFWLEDDAKDFARRTLIRRSRIASTLLRRGDYLTAQHWDRLGAAVPDVNWPIWVDDTHGLTSTEIGLRMRRLVREHPEIRVVMADHLGEIRIDREQRWGDRHDLAVGQAAKDFRDAAKDLGICPVLFVQLNRQVERRTQEGFKLSDLKDSGDIEAAARMVGFLHRPQDEKRKGQFIIDVQKNTGGPCPAEVQLDWMEDFMSVEGEASRD